MTSMREAAEKRVALGCTECKECLEATGGEDCDGCDCATCCDCCFETACSIRVAVSRISSRCAVAHDSTNCGLPPNKHVAS
jgi:hypothetical protein